ncbi:MAG: DUF1579 family protein [Planctomycetaceae bacterium]|nr:DUF1579 family protein [Planctomycetaceae bacterium]
MHCVALMFLALLFLGNTDALAQTTGPNAATPELKPLDRFVGTWEVEVFDKSGSRIGTAQFQAKWILNGRFVEQRQRFLLGPSGKETQLRTLMGYDTEKSVYQRWTFLENGDVITGEGSWSPDQEQLIWNLQQSQSPQSSTLVAKFLDSNSSTWELTLKNGMGQVTGKIEGQNQRLNDAP